jgi:hypothetical protein
MMPIKSEYDDKKTRTYGGGAAPDSAKARFEVHRGEIYGKTAFTALPNFTKAL